MRWYMNNQHGRRYKVCKGQYRSGETSLNCERFNGFTCDRKEAVKTNWPTELENLEEYSQRVSVITQDTLYPARNALKG
jgi:hypothetical protein